MDDPELVLIDYWFTNNQSFKYGNDLFPYKVKNLYKIPLHSSSIPTYPPYIILDDGDVVIYPNKEPKQIADGIELQLFREFGKRYNITLNITIEENLWGEIHYNRTGTFMYGMLLEDKIDCINGAMGTWLKVWILLEFAQPHVTSKVACLTPIPRLKDKFQLVILPFTGSIWLMVFITIIFLTIAFNYISRMTRLMSNEGIAITNQESLNLSLIDKVIIKIKNCLSGLSASFFILYTVTVLQPIPELVQYPNNAFRNLLIWVLLYALVITTSYTSGLTSIMTLPQYEPPIKTQQDLIDSKIEWGSNDDSWVEALVISDEPKIIDLLKTFRVYNAEQLRNPVPEKFGYLVEELAVGEGTGSFTIPEYLSEEALFRSQPMSEEIYWTEIRTFWRKSSPFLPAFNDLIFKFRETGLLFAFQTQASIKYMNTSVQLHLKGGEKDMNPEPVVLRIYDLESVFAIWCFGIIISCISFGFEIFKIKKMF